MADYIKLNKGQKIDKDALAALESQHQGRREDSEPQNVNTEYADESTREGRRKALLEGYDERPVYRYFFADGSSADLRSTEDGKSYEVIEYKPSDTFTTQRRKAENPSNTAGGSTVQERTSSEGFEELDGDLWYVKHFDDGTTYKRRATPAEVKANEEGRQRSRNPGGKTDAEIEKEARDDEDRKARNQVAATNADTTKANAVARAAQEERLNEKQKADLLNGQIVTLKDGRMIQVQNDPTTGAAKVTDVTPQQAPPPSELDGWTPDFKKPGLGLFERQQQLDTMRRPGPNGEPAKLTDQQYKDVLERDQRQTSMWLDHIKAIAGSQKDTFQQESSNYSTGSTNYRQKMSSAGDALQQGRTLFNDALPFTGGEAAANMAAAFLRISEKFLDRMAGEEPVAPVKGALIGEINKMGMLGASGVMPALQGYAQPQAQQAAPTEGGVNPALAQSAAGPDAAESFDMRGHNDAMEQSGQYSPEAMAIWRARTEGAPTSDAPLSWEPAA